ncbi:MAG: YncE family protein [Nocardioides sp.]
MSSGHWWALGVLVLVASCNAGGEAPAVPEATTITPAASNDNPGSAGDSALPVPIPNDAPRAPLRPRIAAVQNLPGGPDWLELAAGHLWVKRDDGHVSQVDIRTARPNGAWSTGYSGVPACQGLTFDGSRLWSCAGENRLARHAPSPGGTAEPFRVPRLGDQTQFVTSNELLWVIDAEATGIVGLDLGSGEPVDTIDLGTFCTDLARPLADDRGVVYAICPTDGLVLAVDVAAGKVTGRLRLEEPRAATIADDLWVAFAGGLAQVDPDTLQVSAVYDVDLGLYGEIWADSRDVWVRAEGRELLTHIDPRARRFVETLTSPSYPSDGDVLVAGGALWTTASDDGVLLKVRLP